MSRTIPELYKELAEHHLIRTAAEVFCDAATWEWENDQMQEIRHEINKRLHAMRMARMGRTR